MFIAILQTLLLGMHYLFGRSMVRFFGITHPVFLPVFYALIGLLSISFISAFFLLHFYESGVTLFYYRFAATWMGFLVHFLVAVAAAWAVVLIAKCTGLSINRAFVAGGLLTMAAMFSLYGIWNAFHPQVREIAIPVRHVPEQWAGRSIVLLSDIHLGPMRGKNFVKGLVKQVNRLDPDIILITGDLLDGATIYYDDMLQPLRHLRARHGVFFVTGNHEYYVGIKKAIDIIEKTGIQILDGRWIDIDGLELVGVGYPGVDSLADIRGLPPEKRADHVRILMFHTPTTIQKHAADAARRHERAYWTPDTSFDLNRRLNPDIQLSGHTHHGQLFPLNFVTRMIFDGYDNGLKQAGGFQIYTTCGTGTWGPPMRTAGVSEITLIRLISRP